LVAKNDSLNIVPSAMSNSISNNNICNAAHALMSTIKLPSINKDDINYDEDKLIKKVKTSKNTKGKANCDLNELINISIESNYKLIQLSDKKSQVIPIKVSVNVKESDLINLEDNRTSMDLVCVIDVSGSMAGEKIDNVKESLKILTNFLTENDRISIVLFNDDVVTLFGLKKKWNFTE